MRSKKFAVAASLLILLMFAIPIEHKYDKLFRFFSLTLIPPGLDVPASYDKKIYFYVSDLIALVLPIFALAWFRIPSRRFFLEKGAGFLWIVFVCAIASIVASPFAHYPLPYIRLLQLLTPILLYCFLANAMPQPKITHLLFTALFIAALLQSGLAIAQYFHQDWFGLRLLGEQVLQQCFAIRDGSRWIFDPLFHRVSATTTIYRAAGTFPHPNVAGGFLTLSLLASYSLMMLASRKWRILIGLTLPFQFFAMCVTFSRSALFAWAIGTLIWFSLMIYERGLKNAFADPALRFIGLVVFSSAAINAILLQDQFIHRGGVVNYNHVSKGSDSVRLAQQNIAFRMIGKNPLTGVGFTQFSVRSPDYFADKNIDPRIAETGAHNIYLFLASETGLISLGALLLFIGMLFRTALRMEITPTTASLAGIFAALLFIGGCDFYPILFQQGKLMFFCCAGLFAGHAYSEKKLIPILSVREQTERSS